MKLSNVVFKACLIIGIFLMFGTAGSSDLGYLDLITTVKHLLIALMLIIIGVLGIRSGNQKKELQNE